MVYYGHIDTGKFVERYLTRYILKDLEKKMVFISGPRQVGKTFLAQHLLNQFHSDLYLNWDRKEHRKLILKASWDRSSKLVVFDELHKYRPWKNWLKGIYDTEKQQDQRFLVTGSARLELLRRGGDSLSGRYYPYRLHPFSVKELVEKQGLSATQALERLWERSGFPEPFLTAESIDAARWGKNHIETLLREDVRSLENIKNLSGLELLTDLLEERIGSPLSHKALSEDLDVAPQTVKFWIELLERFYILFSVRPFSHSLKRSIKKAPKIYFYDYSGIENPGIRFENLIAAHLLKMVHFREDTEGLKIKLYTLRDKEKHEVDFVITVHNRPILFIEAKLSDTNISPSLLYYHKIFPEAKAIQVIKNLTQNQTYKEIQMTSAAQFLAALPC